MIASVTVLGFSVWLTSILFGLIFGVRTHWESSYITAAILFFIVAPTVNPSGLLALLLVGMIAGASKFIVAYKGRHIFNAAAFAAFIASILNIAHESWWVGTPVLAVPTLILGYLILQKTRRVPSSGTFLALATLLVIGVLILEGNTFAQSLVLWFSWPILFFSSFMLTEPLTLPGKRWQQILEAVIVALIFAIPFRVGDFSSSPAFALIIGNLIAFVFTHRQKIRLTFKDKRRLTPSSYELTFIPNKPQRYEAGQYVEIRVPSKMHDFRGSRRSFSMTSAPGEDTLQLGIKFYEPSSTFKKALRELKEGFIVDSTGISGDFTLPKDPQTPLLYVAGGIGITPFISHLRMLMQRREARDIVLFYSISNEAELAYKDVLIASGIKVFVVTQFDKKLIFPKGWTHINAPFVTKDIFANNVPDIIERMAFISGPPAMIDGAKKQLRQLHVKWVKTDYFIGY
jgi:ferredoxin-NADP reductase